MLSFNVPDEDFALSNAYWYAVLSDNTVVYQSEHDSWVELQRHIRENNLKIIHFGLKFRSNTVVVPILPKYKYVYISNAVGRDWGNDDTEKFFVIGFASNDEVIDCYWYKLPELTTRFKTTKIVQEIPAEKNFLYKVPES